jgi:hypothetical protein
VVVGADYPFLDVLWSMIIFFAFVIWIWILITVFIDLFRRHDTSGWAKAAWVIFLIFIPLLGVLIYLIVNHQGMADRSTKEVQAEQDQFDTYVKSVAASSDPGAQIEKAKQLLDSGAITEAEFEQMKAKALAS